VLIDGLSIRTLGIEHTAVVGGDARCHSIACASIIAKVTRDRLMHALAKRHPHYHWETNKGYGTPEHHAGLASHGATKHHRYSFGPVGQLSLALSVAPPEEAEALADALMDVYEPEPIS
jgi:ribonuclease HII